MIPHALYHFPTKEELVVHLKSIALGAGIELIDAMVDNMIAGQITLNGTSLPELSKEHRERIAEEWIVSPQRGPINWDMMNRIVPEAAAKEAARIHEMRRIFERMYGAQERNELGYTNPRHETFFRNYAECMWGTP